MATQATLAKQANALITLFINTYAEKYKTAPTINRYREKWGFQSMIEDLGYPQAQEVIEYYFRTNRMGHPVKYLLNNYDRLYQILEDVKKDEIKRAELRLATERRVKEWDGN